MTRICAWCKTLMGFKAPHEDKSLTHGICEDCAEHVKKQRELRKKEKEAMENPYVPIWKQNLLTAAEHLRRGGYSYDTTVDYLKNNYKDVPEKSIISAVNKVYGIKKRKTNPTGPGSKYCHERLESPSKFAKGSFRTKRIGKRGHKGITACPRGYYHKGVCTTAVHLQAILHPEGEGKCPVGGRKLNHVKKESVKDYSHRMGLIYTILAFTSAYSQEQLEGMSTYALERIAKVLESKHKGNPKSKGEKWYVGITRKGDAWRFASSVTPTRDRYPQFKKVVGPFDNRKHAEQFEQYMYKNNPMDRAERIIHNYAVGLFQDNVDYTKKDVMDIIYKKSRVGKKILKPIIDKAYSKVHKTNPEHGVLDTVITRQVMGTPPAKLSYNDIKWLDLDYAAKRQYEAKWKVSLPSLKDVTKFQRNPKSKTYAGRRKSDDKYEFFTSAVKPTIKTHGDKYKFIYGPYKSRSAAEHHFRKHGLIAYVDLHKDNPPAPLMKGAVKIYGQIEQIKAVKGDDSLWPGQKFKHDFDPKSKAAIYGLPDGSLLIKSKADKKLWKDFKGYQEGVDYNTPETMH